MYIVEIYCFIIMNQVAVIPFLIAIRLYSTEIPEYTYNLKKTIEVFRDPLQTTEYDAKVTCIFEAPEMLDCVLYSINIISTLTYKHLNITQRTTREQLHTMDRFRIQFASSGIQHIFANSTSQRRDLIKEIAYQFDIGTDMVPRQYGYDETEKSILGTCVTTYKTTHNRTVDLYKNMSQQIIFLKMEWKYADDNNYIYVLIEKNRHKCNFSPFFIDFMNGLEMTKFDHTIEMFDDQLIISTILDGHLPSDPWNPSGTPVFRETMVLELLTVLPHRTKFKDIQDINMEGWNDII